jgi:nitrogen fixation-related uncharacterized protein
MGIVMLVSLRDFPFLIPVALVVIMAIFLFLWSLKN